MIDLMLTEDSPIAVFRIQEFGFVCTLRCAQGQYHVTSHFWLWSSDLVILSMMNFIVSIHFLLITDLGLPYYLIFSTSLYLIWNVLSIDKRFKLIQDSFNKMTRVLENVFSFNIHKITMFSTWRSSIRNFILGPTSSLHDHILSVVWVCPEKVVPLNIALLKFVILYSIVWVTINISINGQSLTLNGVHIVSPFN